MNLNRNSNNIFTNIYSNDCLIEKATINDINELEELYDNLNDYLETTINYPGWKKGIYPVRETAENGIRENSLFVLKIDDKIAGSVILNHLQEDAYRGVNWGIDLKDEEVIVIHTFVVNPIYMKNGVGQKLMDFSKEYCLKNGFKTLRLDVSIKNTPAISLYEKSDFKYVDTVDLGLNIPDLIWFKLYEIIF
ncbi:GNAT family N-acetyltransferase [Clostridium folliculivorans]|uniref:N-acetyltransferase n=1 Tax=Clostridium folliculivorans TaxID=2886038 RepID=A0A9W5Y2I7_9CLOT|nr:GNAT family N-acetyltransferase [Clostridium folliculivorans]GKU25551.1 N-acetyltransferase [Clostridium folliculivorans]GKU28574.1 N-acetyltransferase [Clostridium folliculivorans]